MAIGWGRRVWCGFGVERGGGSGEWGGEGEEMGLSIFGESVEFRSLGLVYVGIWTSGMLWF